MYASVSKIVITEQQKSHLDQTKIIQVHVQVSYKPTD